MTLRRSLQWLFPHKWLLPNEVAHWLASYDKADERFPLMLAFSYGFLRVLGAFTGLLNPVMGLVVSVLAGWFVGLMAYYLGGGLLNWAIRVFGGSGDVGQTRAGLFVSSVPMLWVMALMSIPTALVRTEMPMFGAVGAVMWLVAGVWTIVLLTTTLSKIHHTTGVRVFVALLLAAVVAYLPLMTCIGLIGVLR